MHKKGRERMGEREGAGENACKREGVKVAMGRGGRDKGK